ncbi:MAG: PP2C family protein-serine/threonine phosphatase [Bacteroidia bacterium]|jgi:sigma-B regulation protein RsbU (phosphoserine phosphatase)|nr:PP2C family protein-serine/threonine phosphatase [Bacteroidia bacterium]
MSDKKASIDRLRISKFKLDALLDITLSINANLPTEELLSKYELILRNNLGIGKILIYKHSLKWECLLNGGFPKELETSIDVESQLLKFTETAFRNEDLGIEGVDIIIPVYNNYTPLAFILIGDIEEEGEGMSPVIKHLTFIQTISSIIIVAIENIRLFNESLRQEALRKELELAARMQQKLIPDNKTMPQNDHFVVTGFYYPHYEVGGDYYDCIKLSDDKTGFCIADVSGKGISAALLMSNFQASLRALFTHDIELQLLIRKLNTLIIANAAGEKFITFFVARYDHKRGILEYINAGHNPPVLFNTVTGQVMHLHSLCVGIGMIDEIPPVKEEILNISNNSKIVCYTDGLSDLKGDDGKEILTREIVRHITNKNPVETNIKEMLRKLGIPDNNPDLFDDVSIIAADFLR